MCAFAPRFAEATGVGEHPLQRAAQRVGIVRRNEHARLAVDDDLGDGTDARRDDRQPAEHRLEHGEPEALPARGVDEDVGSPEDGGDIWDVSREDKADAQLVCQRRQISLLRALSEHDERPAVPTGHRADGYVDSLLRHEAGHRGHDGPAGKLERPVLAPRARRLVEAVADHLDLGRRQSDAFDAESLQRVADRDHPARAARDRTLDETVGPEAEAVVVVLRRDERLASGGERAEDIRVHEMRVHDVGAADRAPQAQRRGEADERDGELLVERIGAVRVESDEAHVDPVRGERRQQRQEMALRAADPANAVEVNDSHCWMTGAMTSRARMHALAWLGRSRLPESGGAGSRKASASRRRAVTVTSWSSSSGDVPPARPTRPAHAPSGRSRGVNHLAEVRPCWPRGTS